MNKSDKGPPKEPDKKATKKEPEQKASKSEESEYYPEDFKFSSRLVDVLYPKPKPPPSIQQLFL